MLFLPLKALRLRFDSVFEYMALTPEARREFQLDSNSPPEQDPGPIESLFFSVEWLCLAQDISDNADGGVAKSYSLINGWAASDLESTAAAAKTLLSVAHETESSVLRRRARRMLNFAAATQAADGGFLYDAAYAQRVLACSEAVRGLAAGCGAFGDIYLRPLLRASHWLRQTLNKSSSQLTEAVLASAVSALLEAARLTFDSCFSDTALRCLRQLAARLEDRKVLAGPQREWQLDAYSLSCICRAMSEGAVFFLDPAVERAAYRLAKLVSAEQRPDGFLPGVFGSPGASGEGCCCLSAAAQFALCWLLLTKINGDLAFFRNAVQVNSYIRRTAAAAETRETRGGIRGSYPAYGEFAPYQYVSRGAQLYIDSQLLELKKREELIAGKKIPREKIQAAA